METINYIYFIYDNYPYILAAYGYYRAINTGYENYQTGYSLCNGVKKTIKYIFPPKPDPWKTLEQEHSHLKIIDPRNDIILIEKYEDDFELIDIDCTVVKQTRPRSKSCAI